MESTDAIEKITQAKNFFFENTNKTYKPVIRWIKKKKRRQNLTNMEWVHKYTHKFETYILVNNTFTFCNVLWYFPFYYVLAFTSCSIKNGSHSLWSFMDH